MSPVRGITVLLIEDEEDLRDLTRYQLEGLGARVITAGNGVEGMRKLLAESPDLVLCDLRMPVMDGITFAQEVRRTPECSMARLVAFTSLRGDAIYMRALEAGFQAFIAKPLTPDEFEAVAAFLLDSVDPGPSH